MIPIAANPFITSYAQSDGFGKAIFWALFLTSAICWIVIFYKGWELWAARKLSLHFSNDFTAQKADPLNLQCTRPSWSKAIEAPHPLFEIYRAAKQQTLEIIDRNHVLQPDASALLSPFDIEMIESQVALAIASMQKRLEKHLFILSTIATLAPFLGLLGTVWGIFLALTHMQSTHLANNTAMLAGLSTALATTVIGLLIAIPALLGHNVLKNANRNARKDMEEFSHALLCSIELQYRKR